MASPRIVPKAPVPGLAMASPQPANVTAPSLWDPVVRLTHWGIAIAVLLNALVTEGGSLTHVSLGWMGMALLLLRLIWGVLGPTEARFSAFPPNPAAALRHLGDVLRGQPRAHRSHNPAGALMAYAFWATAGHRHPHRPGDDRRSDTDAGGPRQGGSCIRRLVGVDKGRRVVRSG